MVVVVVVAATYHYYNSTAKMANTNSYSYYTCISAVRTPQVSVGSLTKMVGELRIVRVNIAAIVAPIVVVVVLIAIAVPLLIRKWKTKTKLDIEKKIQIAAYKPGNVRYIKSNGAL